MSDNILEITDKTGRKIRLTKKQWTHTTKKHPSISNYLEEIKETIQKPDAITDTSPDESVYYYYKYYKYLISPYKYISYSKILKREGVCYFDIL